MSNNFNALNLSWSEEISLTNPSHLSKLASQADDLLANSESIDFLSKIDLEYASNNSISLGVKVAIKLAQSKSFVEKIEKKTFVSIVFAVYGENNRMLRPDQHPNGEDFLHRKIDQLQWLFDSNPLVDWEMIIVDDGCLNKSGHQAKEILKSIYNNVRIAFLNEAIESKHPATSQLDNTDQSRKGGSILYGMALACEKQKKDNHIIVFTDADLSTHLGQTGLLLKPILTQKKKSAIASRREINSVVIKKGLRNTRGKMFIYLWKRLLPQLNFIIDTQCGFKAFDAELIRKIVYDIQEQQFAFDIELLLRTELLHPGSIEKVAIAWIDSEAESTTGDNIYLDMLHSIVGFYRYYLPSSPDADEWAEFITSLNQAKWDILLEKIPEVIELAEPATLNQDLIGLREIKSL